MHRGLRYAMYLTILAAVLALNMVHAEWHGYSYWRPSRVVMSLSYVLVISVAAYAAGLPDLSRSRLTNFLASIAATAAAASFVSFLQFFTGDLWLPRFVVLGAAAVLIPCLFGSAVLSSRAQQNGHSRDRALLVANVDESKPVVDELTSTTSSPVSLAGVLSIAEARSSDLSVEPLVDEVVESGASVLVLTREAQVDESIVSQAAALHQRGVRVRSLSGFYEEWLGKIPLSELERVALLFDIREIHGNRYRPLKRLLDVSSGLIGAALLIPITPLVALLNLIGNRGPLFYKQVRVGKNGTEFEIRKFRSMRPEELAEAVWTKPNDDRITPWGRVLRTTHLDELPQAINLLRGDLSIVGPRPEQPRYVEQLKIAMPFYDFRHLVRPGLTGWAQVNFRYASDEDDALEKLQYEFYYLRNQSLQLDLRIIARTLRSVLWREGR